VGTAAQSGLRTIICDLARRKMIAGHRNHGDNKQGLDGHSPNIGDKTHGEEIRLSRPSRPLESLSSNFVPFVQERDVGQFVARHMPSMNTSLSGSRSSWLSNQSRAASGCPAFPARPHARTFLSVIRRRSSSRRPSIASRLANQPPPNWVRFAKLLSYTQVLGIIMLNGGTRGRHQYCESQSYASTTLGVHIVQAASARRRYRSEPPRAWRPLPEAWDESLG
jgi:hypothetical protein